MAEKYVAKSTDNKKRIFEKISSDILVHKQAYCVEPKSTTAVYQELSILKKFVKLYLLMRKNIHYRTRKQNLYPKDKNHLRKIKIFILRTQIFFRITKIFLRKTKIFILYFYDPVLGLCYNKISIDD